MSRVINTETAGKERNILLRSVAQTIRELMQQPEPDEKSKDRAAYIVLALERIYNGIDPSISAWEKRGYWVKADRFRMEWTWTGRLATQLREVLFQGEWHAAVPILIQISQHLMHVKLPKRPRLDEPWQGAWQEISQPSQR